MKRLAVIFVLLTAPAAAIAGPRPERTPRLDAVLSQGQPGERHLVWVFFRDKGARPEARLAEARALLTPRALSRRQIRGRGGVSVADLPVLTAYVEKVAATGARVRHASRWMNAVSIEATAAQVDALAAVGFVERLDAVRRYRRTQEEAIEPRGVTRAAGRTGADPHALDYGTSLGQLAQINVPAVHDLGLSGAGVVVAVFDSGFDTLGHQAFTSMSLLGAHDFVNGDDDVSDGADRGEGSHGTATLSTLGGYHPGQLIGPAYGAHFILAKTENTDSETPVEEDHWAAAAEWAEALGADVISSSLGYLTYDAPFTSYTFNDMNGTTAISTRAADFAASLGVVVVNSAGNSGFNQTHNTLGAPADGFLVLAVGAVGADGSRASFSSVGPTADGRVKPDVAAQGVAVKVAMSDTADLYASASGTSFSCPLTAGVVALVLQANPAATVEQVGAVLRGTARNAAAPNTLLGWGIVDALAAVQLVAPPAP